MAEALLMSAATGALRPVSGKLVALLGDEYKRLTGIHTEIKSLTRELETIEAFLKNMAEAEDLNPQDKVWMKEVRELSYDIEDNLDEFMDHIDKSCQPDGFMDKIKSSLKRVKARHEIGKEIEDLKKQAIELSQRNKRYRDHAIIPNSSNSSKIDHRALAIFADASKLVGVDVPKKEIIQLLADGESTQQQTKLVAIVGFGGLGKTTIANQVCQDLKGEFDCHAILSVSRNPDITRVMSTIYGQLNKDYSTGNEDIQTLTIRIKDFLENKRYLIVVDDVWKVDEWEAIKCAFPPTSSGSKIITTTRINAVAESCCSSFSGHIYKLRPLNMMQSRQLLYTRLFNPQEECPLYLQEISDQILEKCGGLPLAIIAISGVLANKRSKKDLWERVKDSIGRALRNSSIETMVNIISLSYLDLPPNLRTCLLYLSIFPEDHIIEKENLIRWIGEGFIHQQESGELCFNELINRSLIQPAEIDNTFGDHEVKSCRVHDTVHDFIICKAVEENFVTVIGVPDINYDPQMKVRRLSLQNNCEIPAGLVVSNARSLHVFGRNVKIPSLSRFRLLRVIAFEECFFKGEEWWSEGYHRVWGLIGESYIKRGENDPLNYLEGIGNLLHLKYLRFKNVSGYSMVALPEELARLHGLEIDIHASMSQFLIKIPETVQWLVRCLTLHVSPYDIVWDVKTDHLQDEFLKGLGQLKNLRRLDIHFAHFRWEKVESGWEEKVEATASSICELGKAELESLQIYIDSRTDEIFEKSWFPGPSYGLRELIIGGRGLTRVPAWMESLVSLEKLSLLMFGFGLEGVKILGALPSLSYLSIQCYDSVPKTEAAVRRAMEAHPNHPTLVWTCLL